MRLQKISIANFRSIKALDLELPNVCALIGPNNAGKSNILDALRRVLAPEYGPRPRDFTDDDLHLRDPELDITIEVTFDTPIPYTKIKGAKPAEVSQLRFNYTRYKIGNKKGERRIDQTCFDANGKTPSVQATALKKGQQLKFEPLVGIPQDVRDQVPFIYIGTNRSLREQLPGARYSLLRQIFEDIDRDLRRPEQTVSVPRADGSSATIHRLERFRHLMAQAMELLRTDAFKEVESAIKRNALEQLGLEAGTDDIDLYFTPLETLTFYKSLDLVVREGEFTISAERMGEGMQNAIVLAVLRAFEETRRKGAILVIEEPEMFLHPHMQRSLYATLRRIGETNQVIYTTHSPHFVSVPDYRDVVLVRKTPERGTYATRSPLPDGTWRREKLRQSLDTERGELFFATRLLIVEGDTEKLALPEYAKKLDLDLDRAGATIVEVGGKKNLYDFAELALSLGIPTGIVYDKDSSDFSGKNKEQEEAAHNAKLDALAKADGSVRVWCLDKDYEDLVRRTVGAETYEKILARYPSDDYGKGKPRRQRMVAGDKDVGVPAAVKEMLVWLTGTTA
jgi:predicted ATP-dependent endonuclease of OLD family